MPIVKRAYRVLPKHREEVAGYEVVTGQIIYLTEAEAFYERDLGYIEPVDATEAPPPPSPFVVTDTIILSRGGTMRVILASELPAFFASALGTTPIDTTAPVILTAPTVTVPENTAFSVALTASETVTWTKTGGADAGLFVLSGSTLSLSAQNFEAPADANADNAYVVQLRATNVAGKTASLTMTVTVTDVAEGGGTPADLTTNFDDDANSALVPGLTA